MRGLGQMTIISDTFPTVPRFGAPLAPGEALPVPTAIADTIVTEPSNKNEPEHRIAIYTSADPTLGGNVKAFSQKLHAEVYLEHGLIGEQDLDGLGSYADKYSKRATYLYVKNGSKVAAARYIHCSKKGWGSFVRRAADALAGRPRSGENYDLMSLPTTEHFDVDPDLLCEAAGIRQLSDIKPEEVIEISGLVARRQQGENNTESSLDATIALYARMLHDSLEQGHKLWLLNVEKGFLKYLNIMIGRDQVKVLGPEKEYMGPPTLPVAINPQDVIRAVFEDTRFGSDMRRQHLKGVLAGVDDRKIPKDIRELLKRQNIPTKEYHPVKRILADPKTLVYSGLLAYSAARALPVAGVKEFHGDVGLLWGIDVATAIPYAKGIIEAFTGKNLRRRAVGAAVGAACFAAPYAYLEMAGEDYPNYVKAIVGGFVGLAVLKETASYAMRHGKNKALRIALPMSDLSDVDPKRATVAQQKCAA
jgi:hypothetical protein